MANPRRRRRKNQGETKLPATTRAYTISSVSAVSVILFLIFFMITINSGDGSFKPFAAIGTVLMFASVVFLIVGVKEFKDTSRSVISRILVLFLPLISLSLWLMLYIIGYLNL